MAILSYYRIYPTAGGIQYVWSATTPTVSLTGGAITSTSTVVVSSINYSNTVNSIAFAQSPYTALPTCGAVICNTAGGVINVNLPDTSTAPGEVFYFTNTGTNSVILAAFSGQTIDGSPTFTLTNTGNRMLAIQSLNGNWTKAIDEFNSDPVVTLNSSTIETNKTLTDPTNIIRGTQLATTGADVVISSGAQPTTGQALIATSSTTAAFGNPTSIALSGIFSSAVIYSGTSNVVSGDTSNFVWDYNKKFLGIGVSSALARLHLGGNITSTSWGLNGIGLRYNAATYTDSNSTGTVASNMIHSILAPTLAATTATTYTNASTLYIDSAPIAGTNVTITKPYALMIGSGDTYYNGNILLGSAASGATRSINFAINSGAKFQLSSVTGDLGWQGGFSSNQQLFSYHGTVISGGRATSTAPSFQTGSSSTYNCVILNTTPNVNNATNTINLIIQKSLIIPIGTDPVGTVGTGDFLQFQTGSGSVGSGTVLAKVDSFGNHSAPHFIGNSATPSIVAGTGVTAATITGTDIAGRIAFTPNLATTIGNIPVVTVTFVAAFATVPYVTICASNRIAAINIASLYVTATTTGFVVMQTAALSSATSFNINYHVTA